MEDARDVLNGSILTMVATEACEIKDYYFSSIKKGILPSEFTQPSEFVRTLQ